MTEQERVFWEHRGCQSMIDDPESLEVLRRNYREELNDWNCACEWQREQSANRLIAVLKNWEARLRGGLSVGEMYNLQEDLE